MAEDGQPTDAFARAAARIASALGPVSDLALLGRGLDFCVFRGRTEKYGEVALRTPLARVISNDNDLPVDSRDLLALEAALAEHVRAVGLPAPRVHDLLPHDDGDILVSELIEGDGSPADPAALGRLTRSLHAAPLPAGGPSLPRAADVLVERIARRVRAVERLAGCSLGVPPSETLAAALPPPGPAALLHMDLRPANLLTRGGAVAALVDWANALVGPPSLELARIAEYGVLDAGFLSGYGPLPDDAAGAPWSLYRLDTAVMLAVVFWAEAPDPARAAEQLRRIRFLAGELRTGS